MRGQGVGARKSARCQVAREGPGSCLDIAREFIGLLVQDDATDFKAELASDNDVTYENNW